MPIRQALGVTILVGFLLLFGMCGRTKGQAQSDDQNSTFAEQTVLGVVRGYAVGEPYPPLQEAMNELREKLDSKEIHFTSVVGPPQAVNQLLGQIADYSGVTYLQVNTRAVKGLAEHYGLMNPDFSDRVAIDMATLLVIWKERQTFGLGLTEEERNQIALQRAMKSVADRIVGPLAWLGRNPLRIRVVPLPQPPKSKEKPGMDIVRKLSSAS